MSFTHLHLHTEYSLLDGVCKVDQLLDRLTQLGMTSVAVTDHGVMYGIYEFYTKCKERGIKPIIGCEIYIAPRTRFDRDAVEDKKPFHMTILAKNLVGYKNLLKIVSTAHLEGMYYKPRADHELLSKYSEGLIGTSGCLNGEIPRALSRGHTKKAREILKKYLSYFGKENFFIEIQRNGVKEVDKVNPLLIELAKEYDVPIIATGDVHYINKGDEYLQEILWCIADGKKITDANRRKYETNEFYIKSEEEILELYKDIPQAVSNTQKIVDVVEEYDIGFGRIELQFKGLPEGKTSKEYLKELVMEKSKKVYSKLTEAHKDRIKMELNLIQGKGYSDYFLVVADYVRWAKENGIIVGPGRGSGAASIIAYCLGITGLDPILWQLPFERFLNPQRPSPPDFDIDFQDTRRDEVVEYLRKTYGENSVSNIGTFGRMKTKAAVKDVARALGIDYNLANTLSKLIPVHQGKAMHMMDAIKEVPEVAELIQTHDELREVSEIVSKIEGTARHVSTHACGVIVTPLPSIEYVPLQRETKSGTKIITQYEGPALETIGLLKCDILGLANLSLINETIKMIKKTRDIEIDIEKITYKDPEAYKIFQNGETLGIFQFESDGMRKYLKELKPANILEISFMAAAYRPGPMAFITPYIECKMGKRKPEYLHPDLIPVLEETYGYPIYQEQIMQIAVAMAGYSLGEADNLRRAMGKKKLEVLMKEKENFLDGMKQQGHTAELAEKLFEYMIPFASYGFNKAHSACYAVVAYQTAYLKAHYYSEFMAVLLQINLGDLEKVSLIADECAKREIHILPPSVSLSDEDFIVDGIDIRFGLKAIKGMSKKTMHLIISARNDNKGKFEHLDDFLDRIDLTEFAKKNVELLIKSGAMDEFGDRNSLLQLCEPLYEKYLTKQKKQSEGQFGLFDNIDSKIVERSVKTKLSESVTSDAQKLLWEKELMGMHFTTHPLAKLEGYLKTKGILTIDQLAENINKKVKIGVTIDKYKMITTKKDAKAMAFVTLEDLTGKIEGVVFPRTYDKEKENLKITDPLIVEGIVQKRDESITLLIDKFIILSEKDLSKAEKANNKEEEMSRIKSLTVKIPGNITKENLNILSNTFKSELGEVAVRLIIPTKEEEKIVDLPYKVVYSKKVQSLLISIVGSEGIKVE